MSPVAGHGFSDVVMEHFMNPRNTGDMAEPCGEGWSGPTNRGYFMRIQLRLEDERVVEARFATFGCTPAMRHALASVPTHQGG